MIDKKDNVIYEYNEQQALKDGELVEVFPDRFPKLYFSRAAFLKCEGKAKEREVTLKQVILPLIIDIVLATKTGRNLEYLLHGHTLNLKHTAIGTAYFAINGQGGLTVFLEEDQ